ncbi:hypothetical protein BH09PSE1_BH09PSE1_29020 [soil metagenome]
MAKTRVTPLLPTELDEALLLAGLGAAGLDAERWRRETLEMMRDPECGGVLIGRSETGRVCGLLRYRIVANDADGSSLEVERLVAFDLMHPALIADALIGEAVRRARLQHCDSLRLVRPLDAPADTVALVLASGLADLHSVF